MKYKALFFDFDGVLVNSVEVKTKAFSSLFEKFGENVARRIVEHHRANGGMSRFDKFRHYYEHFLGRVITDAEMTECCERFARLVVDEVVRAPEISGADAFVSRWRNVVPCFIVSATPQDEIREISRLRGLTGFVEILGSPATKRENLAKLLHRHRLNATDTVFFGDAEADFDAAVAMGINFIGITGGGDSPLLAHADSIPLFENFIEVAAQSDFRPS